MEEIAKTGLQLQRHELGIGCFIDHPDLGSWGCDAGRRKARHPRVGAAASAGSRLLGRTCGVATTRTPPRLGQWRGRWKSEMRIVLGRKGDPVSRHMESPPLEILDQIVESGGIINLCKSSGSRGDFLEVCNDHYLHVLPKDTDRKLEVSLRMLAAQVLMRFEQEWEPDSEILR